MYEETSTSVELENLHWKTIYDDKHQLTWGKNYTDPHQTT